MRFVAVAGLPVLGRGGVRGPVAAWAWGAPWSTTFVDPVPAPASCAPASAGAAPAAASRKASGRLRNAAWHPPQQK